MRGLALQVQQSLKGDPHAGDLWLFRGRKGDLVKILWHDGIGMSLYAKRLERGRFIWPSVVDGAVTISSAQLWTCPGKVEGFPEVKGKLDEQAEGPYERKRLSGWR
jgi:transposase